MNPPVKPYRYDVIWGAVIRPQLAARIVAPPSWWERLKSWLRRVL